MNRRANHRSKAIGFVAGQSMKRREARADLVVQTENMDMVTGGSGFIGRQVVAELVRRGRKVRVYDLRPPRHDLARARDGAVEIVLGDILDTTTLRRALKGCRRVFHLAADPNLWHPDPEHFDRVNRGGTEVLLRLAWEAGVQQVVHTSTGAILAPRRASNAVDECVEVELEDMLGPYCRAKFLAEQAAVRFAERGLHVVIVNPTTPIGPGDTSVTPPTRMIIDFLRGRIPAYADALVDFVDVRDVALGHVLAAEHGVPGRRHLLTGWSIDLAHFFTRLAKLAHRPAPRFKVPHAAALVFAHLEEAIARLTKRPPRAPVSGVRLAQRRVVLDASWTRDRLGLHPRPLDESLLDAIHWLREAGYVPA